MNLIPQFDLMSLFAIFTTISFEQSHWYVTEAKLLIFIVSIRSGSRRNHVNLSQRVATF